MAHDRTPVSRLGERWHRRPAHLSPAYFTVLLGAVAIPTVFVLLALVPDFRPVLDLLDPL